MSDLKGDAEKQREVGCTDPATCPHLEEKGLTNMERETYVCDVCGERWTLYYEDMA